MTELTALPSRCNAVALGAPDVIDTALVATVPAWPEPLSLGRF